jgi:hypothetical protein
VANSHPDPDIKAAEGLQFQTSPNSSAVFGSKKEKKTLKKEATVYAIIPLNAAN